MHSVIVNVLRSICLGIMATLSLCGFTVGVTAVPLFIAYFDGTDEINWNAVVFSCILVGVTCMDLFYLNGAASKRKKPTVAENDIEVCQ